MSQNPKNTTSQTPAASADVAAFLKMYDGLTAGQKAGLTKSLPGPDGLTIQQHAARKAAATRAARSGAKIAKTPELTLPPAVQRLLGMNVSKGSKGTAVDTKAVAALLAKIAKASGK